MRRPGLEGIFAGIDDLVGVVRFSGPCVIGYRDRLRPTLDYGEARSDLYRRIMRDGVFAAAAPGWSGARARGAVGYIVIDDEIALPLHEDKVRSRPLVVAAAVYRDSVLAEAPPLT